MVLSEESAALENFFESIASEQSAWICKGQPEQRRGP
jgi:hypothetical protein